MMAVEKNDNAPMIITGTANDNGNANCTIKAMGKLTNCTMRMNFNEIKERSRKTKTKVSKNKTNGGNHRKGAEAMSVVM